MIEPEAAPIEEEEPLDIPVEEIADAIDEELAAAALDLEPPQEPAAEDTDDPVPEVEEEKVDEPEGKPDDADAEVQVPAADAEAKTATPDDDKPPEEKPSDEFGALEEGTPERTRERFEAVKDKYDALTTERDSLIEERDAVKAESDQWVKAITETGTNPDQFGMSLEYLTLVNSSKPEDLAKAYGIMEGELQELGKVLGKAAPGLNPLNDHLDLKQKVDDGMMEEADAMEVVQARAALKFNQSTQAAAAAQNTQETVHSNALEEVRQLGIDLKARDPNFEAKVQMLTPIIESVVSSGASPDKWKSMIEQTYAKIPEPMFAAPAPPAPNAPNPIRPTGTSPSGGHLEKEPGSTLEAVSAALERGY